MTAVLAAGFVALFAAWLALPFRCPLALALLAVSNGLFAAVALAIGDRVWTVGSSVACAVCAA